MQNATDTIRYYGLHLIIIGLVAMVMRLAIGEGLRPIPHHDGMSGTYFKYADNLIQHGIYSRFDGPNPQPDSLRMPLYSLFLSVVRLFSGSEQWENWVIAIHYILGSLICVLIALLGFQVAGPFVGVVAGYLAAFNVDYYFISIVFLRETTSLFCLLLFINCYVRFISVREWRWGIWAAFFFGIGILNRPETVLIGLLLVIFDNSTLIQIFKKNFKYLGFMILISIIPWSLWVMRNGIVHQHFILFSTDGAWGAYMGQVYSPHDAYTVADPKAMEIIAQTPVEYDWYQEMNREAWRALKNHPWRNLGWAWIKINQTFSEFTRNGTSLLYPLIWIGLPFFLFKGHSKRNLAVTIGIILGVFHLVLGDWNISRPISLLHTKFKDIIIPGAIGFSLMMLKPKNNLWRPLAACFLTLIIMVVLYIAHFRARIVLCDWVLMIGAAYALQQSALWLRSQIGVRNTGSI